LVAGTDSKSHAEASDIEDELEEAEEVDNNYKLQQVAADYQPGDSLKEGTPVFILLSDQPKV
jgi:hypothetical protein